MIAQLQESNWKFPKSLFKLQSHCTITIVMEPTMRKPGISNLGMANRGGNASRNEELNRNRVYQRSFSLANGKKSLSASYFGVESMLLLVCLTASLLFLPLVLPPLPPPPFLLLLLPIGIFALLLILAFMPSNVRDLTYM